MTVDEMVAQMGLQVVSGGETAREITGGFASDLLSCVMAGAKDGNVWVTLQAHPNVVAVASLLNLAAVIVTGGVEPDMDTVTKALDNGVTLLRSGQGTFAVVGRLYALGVMGD